MATPSIKRPKRKQEKGDERPFWKVAVQGVVSGITRYVCSKLLNERTFHWLVVKIPEWADKLFGMFFS
ncbi:hypothetical protein UXJ26_00035 [Burkholderia multivorans]|uniref:hypothetical protein n=1 Tax=Burkholderia multivorans TaxID=87883 RepID=UPI0011B1FBAA|nr:hypothetical protein [Burkholderia multivorans]MBU9461306.1 hypothetical protein [Burkholderia multivorans]MBU9483079.1 hypothetical protein [Burkholderia multivorans]MBU9512209.1 hypothetical protein [Burkholderia multivorans]MCA8481627.1 hypothetical protein [Burkholderia multivorans]MDN7478505.1 hypothetical protein [Burkholderia multivorans]